MLGLVAVTLVEKYSAHGRLLSRLVAAAAVALAVVALTVPAAGLGAGPSMT
ncbi:MAG: hypothetical protein ACRENL_06210 [Candidatus Dormibacteria bacterium]